MPVGAGGADRFSARDASPDQGDLTLVSPHSVTTCAANDLVSDVPRHSSRGERADAAPSGAGRPGDRRRLRQPRSLRRPGGQSPGHRRLTSMLVTATPETISHVTDQGGSLFVRCQRQHLCRGVLFLHATTKEPRSLDGYELFVVEGVLVLTRLPARVRPRVLHLSLEGRRHRRPVASWDGCAFVA